jgi:formylglycine-generating enzyme required for sulfatase activity
MSMPNTTICLNSDCLTVNSVDSKCCEKCGEKILLKDRYQALKLIGQGGFGRTFLARDLDKPSQPFCVIKQFFPTAQGTDNLEKASKLFAQEAIHLEELGKHPQIPELFAYFVTEDQQEYLVQEYIAGENLEDELKSQGVFDENKVKDFLIDVLKVLQFVHKNQVIHRDIKPENIIRRNSDQKLVLVDFGASKMVVSPTALNVTGTVIGSAQYWSPEQSRGKPVFASDLYSLGVTCLYLLTQVDPFQLFDIHDNDWAWRDHLNGNSVSDDFAEVLDKLITIALKKRFQSVDEVLAVLDQDNNISIPSIHQLPTIIQSPLIITNNQPIIETVEFYLTSIKQASKENPADGWEWKITTSKIPHTCEVMKFDLGEGVILEMVSVPGGTFEMGSDEYTIRENTPRNKPEYRLGSEHECPLHTVNIKPFYMGKYPVTQSQYEIINKADPSYFSGKNRPVEQVSWNMAQEFCQRLSDKIGRKFYLPTESQWEYACLSQTITSFYFGDNITTELVNYNGDYTYDNSPKGIFRQQTTDVGTFPPNAFGLYDMHGNVWELCEDNYHEDYINAPDDGTAWIENAPDDDRKIVRGGSWSNEPVRCFTTFRAAQYSTQISKLVGFRVCMDP